MVSFLKFKQRVRDDCHKLAHLNATPGQIAGGFAIGVFISFLPIISARTIVAVALAWLLRQNVPASFVGKSVTLLYFPLVPFIWLAEFRLGCEFVAVQHAAGLAPHGLWLHELLHLGWSAFLATFLGGLIIGAPVAVLVYFLVRRLARNWQQHHPPASNA